MTVTTSFTDNICFGNCQGAASVVSVAGSTNTPINYTWSNLQNGINATNLCNGVYTLTATDALGCFDNFTLNISSPAQITTTSTILSPSCGLCNGPVLLLVEEHHLIHLTGRQVLQHFPQVIYALVYIRC